MRTNIDLSLFDSNDIIIVANNRQVLAIKKSIYRAHGPTKIPKVFSYKLWLEHYWKKNNPQRTTRLLSASELRFILQKVIKKSSSNYSEVIVDELIKSYTICKAYFINISKISSFPSSPSNLFIKWIREFEIIKKTNNFIDSTDLSYQVINLLKASSEKEKYYLYGFKKNTPEQNEIFKILNCQSLKAKELKNNIQAVAFNDEESEILRIAKWAKEISAKNSESQIGIVIPNLSELQHLIRSSFDQEFNSSLLETHHKPYNISLGVPLVQYPLIKDLLSLLEISTQIINGNIEVDKLIKVITSPYIKGAQLELNSRSLSVTKILSLSSKESSLNKILPLFKNCPILIEILTELKVLKFNKENTLEDSLESINLILSCYGFTSDRILSSTEYQLFEKYQNESLILNRLSNLQTKENLFDVISILKSHLSRVIFQPKSGISNIHILGSLEAEGLYFDHAWVSSMTSNFLPSKIKMPLFIPQKTSVEYSLPSSSFHLVTEESNETLNALNNLSQNLTYSYAKLINSRGEFPTPFIKFIDYPHYAPPSIKPRELEYIDDFKAPSINNFNIRKGVKTLQNQMSCSFKGFSERFQIDDFDLPHVGLNRLEQGNLIHAILETFFNEITSNISLLNLSENELDKLIKKHIEYALEELPRDNFKFNEKIRLVTIIHNYLELEKQRSGFEILETESTSEVNINGLKFSTRIDRMDQLEDGSKLIIDYKTGNGIKISQMIGDPIEQAQLPIYAISNAVDNVAFATINSNNCQFNSINKNKSEWVKQINEWTLSLNTSSLNFQNGIADVLPTKNACDFCEYDLLCRVDKTSNN